MPNALAYLALFVAVPAGTALFFVMRPPAAALMVFLSAFMFLPEKTLLDLPGLPGVGKEEVAALACLFGMVLRSRRRLREARVLRGVDRWWLLFVVGAFGTAMTNKDVLVFGPVVLPGLSLYEGFSVAFSDAMLYLLPFVIGRALFTTARDLRLALGALCVAAALYTPFVFIEKMLSPQLHNWIYGFHQHDFVQTLRGGGYRPMVFMGHGLAVAFFLAWGVIAGVTLFKAKKTAIGLPTTLLTPYVGAFLLAAKSLGAVIYAAAAAPMLVFLRPRTQLRVALVLVAIVFSYPLLRATDVFPERALVNLAYSASGDRAASLDYRFRMETMLAERAGERPVFGWGRFRRNMVLDPDSGKEMSVSDGFWVILYGVRGGWGFICFLAYLTSGVFLLRKRLKYVEAPEERVMLCGLALILGIISVDLLPNGLFNTFSVFLAGILYGATKGLSAPQPPEGAEQPIVRSVR